LMSFSMPIQWFHSHEDPIWPDGTFKTAALVGRLGSALNLLIARHFVMQCPAHFPALPPFFIFKIILIHKPTYTAYFHGVQQQRVIDHKRRDIYVSCHDLAIFRFYKNSTCIRIHIRS
jgi:hypothetical protein